MQNPWTAFLQEACHAGRPEIEIDWNHIEGGAKQLGGNRRWNAAFYIGKGKGSAVKIESTCVLLALLSTSALSGLSHVPIDSENPPIKVSEAEARPIALTSSPLDTPVGAIALEASSDRPPLGTTRSDTHLAQTLSTYLHFHMTWNESLSTPTTVGLSNCSE